MAYLNKLKLSESAFGRGIKIGATHGDFDTLIHSVNCEEKDVQELWVWAHNESTSSIDIYLCLYKPDSNEKTSYKVSIPPGLENSPTLVSPGLVIKNGSKVKAYTSVSDTITIYGYVNQLNQTTILAELKGFGSNAFGESTHPSIGGKNHEILFNKNGETIACGNQWNLAVRPNGSIFSWGAGNIVNQLLLTGDNSPWKNNVDVYGTNDSTIVASNGIPPHDTPYKNLNATNPGGNPNKAYAQDHYFILPKTPEVTGYGIQTPRGNVGVAIDGIPFDTRTAETWSGMHQWEEVGGPNDLGIDSCGGHTQPNGKYHYHINPKCLYSVNTGSHSPIIGYAFDGLPIYGPIGYTEANNTGSGVSVMESSYRLKQGNRPSGSGIGPGGVYDGKYVADYEYVTGLGTLDKANARFAITPEHPTGSWHYHTTVTGITSQNTHGISVYPFVVGPMFKGTVKACSISGVCDRPVVFPPKALSNISQIEVGENHAIALKSDGGIVTWGDNTYGQCQQPTQLSNGVTKISAGADHSMAIQAGKIISWGRNDLGQVDGVAAPRLVSGVIMTNSGSNYSLPPSVSIDGGGGEGAAGTAVLAGRALASVSLVTGGSDYTQAPTILFEGGGGQGASGVATLTSSSENPALGYVSNVTLTNSGSGYTSAPIVRFIDDSSACLTQAVCGTGASGIVNLDVTSVSGVLITNAGNGYSTAPSILLTNDGEDNTGGDAAGTVVISGVETGLAYPLSMGGAEISGATHLSAGVKHSLAIVNNAQGNKVFSSWGDNTHGQINAPNLLNGVETPKDIKAGGYHGIAIVYNNSENQNYATAWGGQGTQNYDQASVPVYAKLGTTNIIGDKNLQIAAGSQHSLILNPDGTISGFGNNGDGRSTGGASFVGVNSVIAGPMSQHSFSTINDVSSKQCLLRSSGGAAISVDKEVFDWKTCADKTHIHRTSDNPNGVEELWLWAYNTSSTSGTLELYLEPKEVSTVTGISMIDGGAGYTANPTVVIEGGAGQNATASAEMLTNSLTDTTGYLGNLTLSTNGSGYYYEPKITFTGGADDPSELVQATAKAHIETGQTIRYSIPPQSGLFLLQPGLKLENLYNIRAASPASHLSKIQLYGYVNRLEKGTQGSSFYHDNPYQISGSLDCVPLTALVGNAASGDTVLSVANEEGFVNGNEVTINPYSTNEEQVTITGFGASFKISGSGGGAGIFQAHSAGERIILKAAGSLPSGSGGSSGGNNGGSSGGDPYGGESGGGTIDPP
jgi:hypothetical protein